MRAQRLLFAHGMRTLALLVALPLLSSAATAPQGPDAAEGTTITSAQVSGIDDDRLSPGLRRDIEALVSTQLEWARVRALASRIEEERPGVAASVRAVPVAADSTRVIFLVARVDEDDDVRENVNARYTIESAAVEGAPEPGVSQGLRDEIQSLVGTRVDSEALRTLTTRLRDELPGYDVRRRLSRGSERGQLRLVFSISPGEDLRWLRFAPTPSKLLFHSEQGWSGLLDLQIGDRDWRVSPIFALDNRDDLVEEYSGVGARIETRKVGTDRLGAALEMSWFEQTWQDETLAALALQPRIPEAYRNRSTVAPSLAFAITRNLHVGGGVSITELESLAQSPASQMANALTLSAGYDRRWRQPSGTHTMDARFDYRAGTEALQSDLVYKRYLLNGRYVYEWGRNTILASGSAGTITSDGKQAPLFERFTLGDSSTLRGWNKYDIAPAGGERVFHTSVEYRNRGFAFFFDAGVVRDAGVDGEPRTSAGFGYHHDSVFITLGFPLNTDDLNVMFMAGVRF